MARNRKRAKERRARRPQPVASRRAGARPDGGRPDGGAPNSTGQPPVEEPAIEPSEAEPIEPTEAEPIEPTDAGPIEPTDAVPGPVEDVDGANPLAHAAPDVELADAQIAVGGPGVADEEFQREEKLVEEEIEEERAATLPAVTGERVGVGSRLVGFLQGSWRELQRVQWPDRRQVAQATGVVIGFVIVAGVFLGLSDLVAQKLVNYILK